jgi:hypothetical protein
MKVKQLALIVSFIAAAVTTLPTALISAQANTEVGVKARCIANPTRALTALLKEKVTTLYTQAGNTQVRVVVTIRAQRGQLTTIKFANVTGVTGVSFKTDAAGGAQITTNTTPVAASCAIEGTATIKVNYLPSGATGFQRKSVTTTQTVSLDGYFL